MKLSIVTINRNNTEGLRKTIESVVSQSFNDFEYIVIDGASTDSSVDVIKEYQDKITYWVSEPDSGVYQAMNKGIKVAKGEYLLMLNSGDFLVSGDVLHKISSTLDGTDIIQGNVIEERGGESIRVRGYGRSNISFIDVVDGYFLHQAMFIKKSLHEEYGLYEDEYKKAADSYFFIKAMGFGNAGFKYVDIDVANFDVNGISSMNDPKWIEIDKEEDRIWYRKNMPSRILQLYKDASKKMVLYDTLRSNKIVWKLTMLFVYLLNVGKKTNKKRIEEKI